MVRNLQDVQAFVLSKAFPYFRRIDEYWGMTEITFFWQDYYWLYERIKPKTTLLDLGAFIGDTAFYFIMNKNIKHIYSFEIDKEKTRKMQKYVEKSPFKKKITIFEKGITSPVLTELVKRIKGPVVIKCDVEGAERDLFNPPIAKNVYALQIETHDTHKEVMGDLKKQGFRCKLKYLNKPLKGQMQLGYIYAER